MIESRMTQDVKPIVKGMPFFSTFDVRVHALYQEGEEFIETDSISVKRNTGVGGEYISAPIGVTRASTSI